MTTSVPVDRIPHDHALHAVGLGAEEHPRQVDRVAADVVQRSAADREDVPDVGRVVVVIREPALNRGQVADATGCEAAPRTATHEG